MKKSIKCWIIGVLVIMGGAVFAQTEGDFQTAPDGGGGVVITRYTGPGGALIIPAAIDGKPVTAIGRRAFYNCTGLTSITIPEGVTSIGDDAFFGLRNLSDEVRSDIEKRFGGRVFYSAFYHVSFIKR